MSSDSSEDDDDDDDDDDFDDEAKDEDSKKHDVDQVHWHSQGGVLWRALALFIN